MSWTYKRCLCRALKSEVLDVGMTSSPLPSGLFVICGSAFRMWTRLRPTSGFRDVRPVMLRLFLGARSRGKVPTMLLEPAFSGVQLLLRHGSWIMTFVLDRGVWARREPAMVLCSAASLHIVGICVTAFHAEGGLSWSPFKFSHHDTVKSRVLLTAELSSRTTSEDGLHRRVRKRLNQGRRQPWLKLSVWLIGSGLKALRL